MWGLSLGRAEFTVVVKASGQQIVQQPLLDGLELGNDGLGFPDGGVKGVEDGRNQFLFRKIRNWEFKLHKLGFAKTSQCATGLLIFDKSTEG